MKSGDSFQRKFSSDFVIFPFSIRNVPSRVRPVTSTVRWSRNRMSKKWVTSSG